MEPIYLSIQPVETGKRIKQLLSEQHYTGHLQMAVRKILTEPGQFCDSQQNFKYQY